MGNKNATCPHRGSRDFDHQASFPGGRHAAVGPALQADGRSIDGDPILVVDTLDAGRAEKVIITSDGKGTRELLHSENTPALGGTGNP